MVESASDEFARITQARVLLDAVGPMLAAYHNGLLTYVALNQGGESVIPYARLELSVDARAPEKVPSTCCC